MVTRGSGVDPRRLGATLEFLRLLMAVGHSLEIVSKRMEAQLGLTSPQRLVLRMVGRFPGITAGELADLLHVHPSTLTGVLQRLQRRGLLARQSDRIDRRRSLIALTPAGRRRGGARASGLEAAVAGILRSVPPADLAGTRRALTALVGRLAAGTARRPPRPRGRRRLAS
jgi:DNA-binding MarR family transcriptional regulator